MTTTTLLLLCLLVGDAPVSADTQLAQARAAYEELEYEQAANEMMLVATRDDATEAQKIEANLYAGMANVIMAREVRARLNFRYVLARRPDTALPDGTSPKVSSFFALVKEEVGSERPAAAAAPVAAAQPASSPPEREVAPVDEAGFPWLLSAGAVTTGGAVVFTGFALVTALLLEVIYAAPNGDVPTRGLAATVGPIAWGVVVLGVVTAAAGGGLMIWGVLE